MAFLKVHARGGLNLPNGTRLPPGFGFVADDYLAGLDARTWQHLARYSSLAHDPGAAGAARALKAIAEGRPVDPRDIPLDLEAACSSRDDARRLLAATDSVEHVAAWWTRCGDDAIRTSLAERLGELGRALPTSTRGFGGPATAIDALKETLPAAMRRAGNEVL